MFKGVNGETISLFWVTLGLNRASSGKLIGGCKEGLLENQCGSKTKE